MADYKKPKMAVMIGMGGKEEPDQDEGEFTAPEGMNMEGKKPGDMLEAVVTLEVKEGGKLCVRKVNGMDVPGYEDKEKPEEDEKKKGGFTDAVMGPEEGQPAEEGEA